MAVVNHIFIKYNCVKKCFSHFMNVLLYFLSPPVFLKYFSDLYLILYDFYKVLYKCRKMILKISPEFSGTFRKILDDSGELRNVPKP